MVMVETNKILQRNEAKRELRRRKTKKRGHY
jgi:hypothetical protein